MKPAHTAVEQSAIDFVCRWLEGDQYQLNPGWFWSALIRTIERTDIKRWQALGLVWYDIDFQRRELRVPHRVKADWWRIIPMDDALFSALTEVRERTERFQREDVQPDDQVFNVFLFRGQTERKTGESQLRAAFDTIYKRLNIRISAESLRASTKNRIRGGE